MSDTTKMYIQDIIDNLERWSYNSTSIYYETPSHWYMLMKKEDKVALFSMSRINKSEDKSMLSPEEATEVGKAFLATRKAQFIPEESFVIEE